MAIILEIVTEIIQANYLPCSSLTLDDKTYADNEELLLFFYE